MTDTRPLDEQSLPELTKQLSRDVSALVRSEVALAKAEVSERASIMGRGAAMVGVGVLFGLITVSCLVAASVAALSLVVDVWLAALIVAAIALVIAAVVAKLGLNALKAAGPPIPRDTIESAKEDVAWVRTQAKSGAK
jgi:HEAT repeat protein